MASAVSENGGDSIEEMSYETDVGELKLNGEINGSCEEPMEIDDSPAKSLKKVNSSSDVNCIEESDRTSNNKETNLSSETSDENIETAVSDEVPENREATNSNGVEEENVDKVDGDDVDNENKENIRQKRSNSVTSQENEINEEENELNEEENEINEEENEINEEENEFNEEENEINEEEEDGTEDVVDALEEEKAEDTIEVEAENEQNEQGEEDDDDVVLMDEEACEDPLAAESHLSEQDTPNNENDSDNNEGSDIEQVEECDDKDPFAVDNDQAEDDKISDDSKHKESKDKSKNVSKDIEKETSNDNDESKDEDKMEEDKNETTPEKKSDEDDKTPEKSKKKKDKVQQPVNITPRRSSRNVNKPKTYTDEPDIKPSPSSAKKSSSSDDPDIEEIVPQDPLAMDSPVSDKKNNKKAVVVNDPKRLVEIVSGNKPSKQGKKEPTLVIIDTNSILSGKGPIPVSPSPPMAHASSLGGSSRGSFSVLPMALPAQGMYPQGMRPPPLSQLKPIMAQPAAPSPPPATPKPVILPSLTDDMYVVEAPSFIVPYVYEKPPIKPLKGYVEQVEQAIKEIKALLAKEKEREKEEKAKEKEREKEEKAKEKKAKEDKVKEEKAKEDKEEGNDKENSEDKEKDDGEKEERDDKSDTDKEKDETKKDQSKKISDKEDEKMDVDTEDDSVTEIKDDDKADTKSSEGKSEKDKSTEEGEKKKSSSYFDNPLGKFFIQIGINLVQEHVQTDLLRSQKRKKEREGKCTPEVQQAMNSLIRSLEYSKETNEPFKLELKKCEYCSFKTESALVMAHHLETPHMRNYVYKCNFCSLEVRSPHDILYHMEAEHNVRGRLERAPAFHQCPSCPFEDNQKGKLSRHLLSCAKKYRPERNQEPPLDFEPPAKIPRVSRTRPAMSPGNAVYQAAMSGLKQSPGGHPLLPKLVSAPNPAGLIRGRGRPQMINRYLGDMRNQSSLTAQQKALAAQMRPGMLYRPSGSNAQPPVLLPASYQLQGSQLYQNAAAVAAASAASKASAAAVGSSTAKLLQQPSISITPLPRQAPTPQNSVPSQQANKPGRPAGNSNSKATFVICEICDGYIKDLEQLRNHMQWIHKVKIHPKMIYNRPPLNCQKCQFRFFTDQGLERHLLGSHGLVTSSMQEAANKGKDGGRCPVCGRVYQWKLLNHVARDHSMSLKPAHLSYKCTVCTATFGMYKQFENHVYSAHSVVAKRVMDKKPSASGSQASTSSSQGDMLKPLKINDEITIIPQPARSKTKPVPSNNANRNPPKKV